METCSRPAEGKRGEELEEEETEEGEEEEGEENGAGLEVEE